MAGILKKILFTSIGKVASTMLATFSTLSCAMAQQPTVRWASDPADPKAAHVEVAGVVEATLQELARANTSAAQWQRHLAVYAQSSATDMPPMLGSYRVDGGIIHFQPQFPLQRGMQYRAVYRPQGGSPVTASFELPAIVSAPSTVVSTVYPTADVVPENLLKFYLKFSAPMSRGDVYDHIHLLDSTGKAIELPFLQLNEELWDPAMTRLTLLFDPGRIKRGVQPLEEIGPALVEGKRFSLVIDRAWKDAAGQPLKEPFRKEFSVGPADRSTPFPARWKISPPVSGAREPIRIEFGEPMEHALALRMIGIADESGKAVEGEATLDDHERRWNFTPAAAWRAGSYRIVVRTTIEDLAGNNIGKTFDVDLASDPRRQVESPTVQIPFEVR